LIGQTKFKISQSQLFFSNSKNRVVWDKLKKLD